MTTKVYALIVIPALSVTLWSQGVAVNETGANPDPSAILDASSTSKGLLPPRMTSAQRDEISSPSEGLMIYNTDDKCLQFFQGLAWYSTCSGIIMPNPVLGSEFNNGFESNNSCTSNLISVTPCSLISGATINDDLNTTTGVEYDWTGATGFIDGGTTQALVEIGGQCWYRRNADNIPANYNPVPTWVNSNDVGWSGYYSNQQQTNEGRLYQWSAAMNGDSTERTQGVCPSGWHVPSDCEWMYLEHSLGMSVGHQQNTGWRNSGTVGSALKLGGLSGFTGLYTGYRYSTGAFQWRTTNGYWWSSSESSATEAWRRSLNHNQVGSGRTSNNKDFGLSIRCLKD